MRAKIHLNWKTGKRCRYWRKQRKNNRNKCGGWQGSAIVLAHAKALDREGRVCGMHGEA